MKSNRDFIEWLVEHCYDDPAHLRDWLENQPDVLRNAKQYFRDQFREQVGEWLEPEFPYLVKIWGMPKIKFQNLPDYELDVMAGAEIMVHYVRPDGLRQCSYNVGAGHPFYQEEFTLSLDQISVAQEPNNGEDDAEA